MGTRISLGGWTVRGPFSWESRAGTSPVMAVADVGDEGAAALLGENGAAGGQKGGLTPVVLRMGISGEDTAKASQDYAGLYVVGEVPRMSPNQGRRVLVADRRWFWSRAYFYKCYNVTRKVGTKRLTAPNQVVENSTLDADVAYAPWSLIGGADIGLPWNAKTLLESLGAAIVDAEQTNGLRPPEVRYGGVAQKIDGTPIQDLTLDGQLDECIERAMAYLPGVAVTVDQDGSVRFFDTADNAEAKVVLGGSEIVGRGHAQRVSFARERPAKIRVLFSINAELRFDYREDSRYGTGEDDTFCENVAPVPDPSVTVNGATLVEGSWVPLESLYTAWGALPDGSTLTNYAVRRAMVPFMDFWSGLILAGRLVPDADWSSRIGVVQQNFRQTFQINRRWMDRIREFRIGRVGTFNPETGTYGKAPVFSDYAYLPSQRSQYVESQGSTETAWIANVAAWPSGGTITATTRAAAADLEMVDHDQGVVRINFLADRFRTYEQALPSQVECDGDNTQPGVSPTNPGPRQNIAGFSVRPCGWNFVGAGEAPPILCGNDRKAFIVSAVPASPNDKSGLVAIDVLPTNSGVPDFPGRNDCAGPVMEIRIAPSVEVARIPWTDANGDTIRSFFTRSTAAPQLGIDEIRGLCINASGDPEQGASLEGIAQGVAAAVWVSLRDRVVGTKETVYSPASVPVGNLSAVTHTLAPDTGAITTGYSLPDRVPPLDVSRYLPESVKRFINRIVSPGA